MSRAVTWPSRCLRPLAPMKLSSICSCCWTTNSHRSVRPSSAPCALWQARCRTTVHRLQASHTSLTAKETALLALARLDSVRAEQFLAFWEGELRNVYRYKLMLASLEAGPPLDADTFLRVALDNAHRQILSS